MIFVDINIVFLYEHKWYLSLKVVIYWEIKWIENCYDTDVIREGIRMYVFSVHFQNKTNLEPQYEDGLNTKVRYVSSKVHIEHPHPDEHKLCLVFPTQPILNIKTRINQIRRYAMFSIQFILNLKIQICKTRRYAMFPIQHVLNTEIRIC